MAYIDKTLWYDQDDRYIPTENEKESWDWDFRQVSIRHRTSDRGGDLISIELWGEDGVCQEVMFTKQNAMRLADTLKMAVVEFTVEEMVEDVERRVQKHEEKLDWLQPAIMKEIERLRKDRKKEEE